jgi:hypothetical protein
MQPAATISRRRKNSSRLFQLQLLHGPGNWRDAAAAAAAALLSAAMADAAALPHLALSNNGQFAPGCCQALHDVRPAARCHVADATHQR